MKTKTMLMMALVALGAVAIATRVPQIRSLVFSN